MNNSNEMFWKNFLISDPCHILRHYFMNGISKRLLLNFLKLSKTKNKSARTFFCLTICSENYISCLRSFEQHKMMQVPLAS